MKKVTVVTITHNRGQYNTPSIQSILSQTYQDFHYLVVNDGSTDNTKELLDSIKHPNLMVIHQENKGFTNTLVDVLQKIDTPYVAIHGAGDISHPERLERQMELLESDESIGAVGCSVQRIDHQGQPMRTWNPSKLTLGDVRELLTYNFFNHGEVTFRYSAYLKAGGYRRFFRYAQDLDLWLRIASFAKLTKVNSLLYNQVMIPKSSISYDYQKVELQATFCAFARYLAKRRWEDKLDELDEQGEKAFSNFGDRLSHKDKNFISNRIIKTAEINYYQTGNHNTLINAAQRVLELNPNNNAAQRYLKLANFTFTLNWLGFKKIAQSINNEESQLIKRIRKFRKQASNKFTDVFKIIG